jgi:hypothetical protein
MVHSLVVMRGRPIYIGGSSCRFMGEEDVAGLIPACVRLSRLAAHPLEGSVGNVGRGLRL